MCISFVYMFRATMCPSSGETTVFIRINTIVSHDDGHIVERNVEKRNTDIKKNCAQSWLYLQDYTWMDGQQNMQKCVSMCVT